MAKIYMLYPGYIVYKGSLIYIKAEQLVNYYSLDITDCIFVYSEKDRQVSNLNKYIHLFPLPCSNHKEYLKQRRLGVL